MSADQNQAAPQSTWDAAKNWIRYRVFDREWWQLGYPVRCPEKIVDGLRIPTTVL